MSPPTVLAHLSTVAFHTLNCPMEAFLYSLVSPTSSAALSHGRPYLGCTCYDPLGVSLLLLPNSEATAPDVALATASARAIIDWSSTGW